jgi:hypothetical protein
MRPPGSAWLERAQWRPDARSCGAVAAGPLLRSCVARPQLIVLELCVWSFRGVEATLAVVWRVEAVLESFLVLWGCDGGALL